MLHHLVLQVQEITDQWTSASLILSDGQRVFPGVIDGRQLAQDRDDLFTSRDRHRHLVRLKLELATEGA